jgi:gluconate 2-dehydrogenase alpha chain
MATKLKEVDAVVVGLGWTGGILGKELAEAGLKVVALERGAMRSTDKDFAVPYIRDELRYVVRHDLMQNTARDTLTIRNNPSQEALPMRRLGSFLPGEVVGGSGVHWSGHTWRWTDMEFKVRSLYEERYGRNFIPADMTIADWGITYAELEPYYEKFERVAAVSGKAGNLRGQIVPGGNPFEGPRQNEYALPPLATILSGEMFAAAAKNSGYHPFPRPSANASRAYTNPDGAHFSACQYCGYCQRFGCEADAKGSPHMTVIPIALRNPNFELRTYAWVTRVQGFRRQTRHWRELHEPSQWRGVRAAGRHGSAVRLCAEQRAPDAAVAHRRAVRSGAADWRHRQELLLSDGHRRNVVFRRPTFQPVHECGRHECDHRRLQH